MNIDVNDRWALILAIGALKRAQDRHNDEELKVVLNILADYLYPVVDSPKAKEDI